MRTIPTPDIGIDLVLRTIDLPLLVFDDEGTVVAYEDQIADLIGVPREEALGSDELGRLAYGEPGRLTMGEKVARAPGNAHEEYDLDRTDDSYALLRGLGGPIYEDRSTTKEGQDIWFVATPLYRDGDFLGVLEVVQDQSDSERRQVELETLLGEIRDTLAAFERGEFDARVEFDQSDTLLEEELLSLTDYVNDVGAALDGMTSDFEQDLESLTTSLGRARELAAEIESGASDQETAFENVQDQFQAFTARMQEVASKSEEIAGAVEDARRASDSGIEAIEAASDSSGAVLETSESLLDTVVELEDRTTDIEEVADIIADIADQTNILALNANIEAARAGEAGAGFAVVAEEVKDLASETREHTDRIAAQIDDLRTQVDRTTTTVRETHDHVKRGDRQVTAAAEAFETIVEKVETATSGVEEISRMNERQVQTIEGVTTIVDEAVETATENRDRSEEIAWLLR